MDVHNGDGVAHAFYDRSDVMTISLHENPKTLFPGTGFEDEIGEEAGPGLLRQSAAAGRDLRSGVPARL